MLEKYNGSSCVSWQLKRHTGAGEIWMKLANSTAYVIRWCKHFHTGSELWLKIQQRCHGANNEKRFTITNFQTSPCQLDLPKREASHRFPKCGTSYGAPNPRQQTLIRQPVTKRHETPLLIILVRYVNHKQIRHIWYGLCSLFHNFIRTSCYWSNLRYDLFPQLPLSASHPLYCEYYLINLLSN